MDTHADIGIAWSFKLLLVILVRGILTIDSSVLADKMSLPEAMLFAIYYFSNLYRFLGNI